MNFKMPLKFFILVLLQANYHKKMVRLVPIVPKPLLGLFKYYILYNSQRKPEK